VEVGDELGIRQRVAASTHGPGPDDALVGTQHGVVEVDTGARARHPKRVEEPGADDAVEHHLVTPGREADRRIGQDVHHHLVLASRLRQVRSDPAPTNEVPEIVGVQVDAGRQRVGQPPRHRALARSRRTGDDDDPAGHR
jgi:hypothetical protein